MAGPSTRLCRRTGIQQTNGGTSSVLCRLHAVQASDGEILLAIVKQMATDIVFCTYVVLKEVYTQIYNITDVLQLRFVAYLLCK